MKKTALLIVLVITMLMTVTLQAETKEIEVIFNNVSINVNNGNLDSENILYNNTTYIPLEAVGEAFSLNAEYDHENKRVDFTDGEYVDLLAIDRQPKVEKSIKTEFNTVEIYINNELIDIDNILYNNKIYIPVRKIAELMNTEVVYDNYLKTIYLNPIVTDNILKVGFVTDSGTIDDKFYNQATWEGLVSYANENKNNIEITFIKPNGESNEDFLDAYAELVDREYTVIFSAGYKFESAVYTAQNLYPNVTFIIIDGAPYDDNFIASINDNTRSIYFKEEELGFYAGVMAAINSKTGNVGFIGGMKIPPVEKFGWGYAAGVAYANRNFGDDYDENMKHNNNARVSNYIYQGTFTDVTDGFKIANSFFENDIDVIFSPSGGVNIGVIGAAKLNSSDDKVWVIGLDVDMYDEGMLDDGTSVILTSTIKDISKAIQLTMDEIVNGTFEGGTTVYLGSSDNGLGIPKDNPNLSESDISIYNEVYSLVANGEVIVPSTLEDLEIFFEKYGYKSVEGISY